MFVLLTLNQILALSVWKGRFVYKYTKQQNGICGRAGRRHFTHIILSEPHTIPLKQACPTIYEWHN